MKTNKFTSNNKKGFTIIELIVCMAIIAVLSSFMIPKLIGYTKKAEDLKKQDTGRKLYSVAMESYVSNNYQIDNAKLGEDIESLMGVEIDNEDVSVTTGSNVVIVFDGVTYTMDLDSTDTNSPFAIGE
ncbi:type II secretion system protein [Clostridium sp. DL1XJH146]